MGFADRGIRTSRLRLKRALLHEATAAGAEVVDVREINDERCARRPAVGSPLEAFLGVGVGADTVQVFRLRSARWSHFFVQPYADHRPLRGEHHATLRGSLPEPAILRRADPGASWDPASGEAVAQQLSANAALAGAVANLTSAELPWDVQLRSVGDGTTHVVMQTARADFRGWLALCAALQGCLGSVATAPQLFPEPPDYESLLYARLAAPHDTPPPGPALDYFPFISAALRRHQGKRVWIGSAPPTQLANLRSAVLPRFLSEAPILAAIDLSLFGSAKSAIVVTPTHFVYTDVEESVCFPLASLRTTRTSASAKATTVEAFVDGVGAIQIPLGMSDAAVLDLVQSIASANSPRSYARRGHRHTPEQTAP